MLSDVIFLALGAAFGGLIAYWFERREFKMTERENEALHAELNDMQAELTRLRSLVYSLGGQPSQLHGAASENDRDLVSEVAERARATQDADGAVNIRSLVSHFVAKGHDREAVNGAVDRLVEKGGAERRGHWLMLP